MKSSQMQKQLMLTSSWVVPSPLTFADGTTHATNLIDLAEKRKDVVVFISPRRDDVVNVANSTHKHQMSRISLTDLQVHHMQSLIVDTSICLTSSMTYSDLFH